VGVKAETSKRLALKSGNCCAFPGCGVRLILPSVTPAGEAILGEIAHISGSKPGSARFDAGMAGKRDDIDNLIYLCPNHHVEIDTQRAKYPTPTILGWKRDHELRIRRVVEREMADVAFADLGLVCDAIVGLDLSGAPNTFNLTEIELKIDRNDLSVVANDIKLGVSRSNVVRTFIESETKRDALYEDRLRNGFKQKYLELASMGLGPVEVFLDLVEWSRRNTKGGPLSPAMAVVSTLFESCDIFKA